MKLIHTSDWHLGRIFASVHLTEDQAYVLDQFITMVQDTKPDVILIVGDVYDRAVPPPDAVKLLDEVLSRIVLDLGTKVIMISGNHDSPERLAFGARLLSGKGFHVAAQFEATPYRVTLEDKFGPVHFYALPYAEPAIVKERLGRPDIIDQNAAMKASVERIWACHPTGERSVLAAHAFVAGSEESESERALSIGGTGAVDVSSFKGFSYVALGHLHRPQAAGGNHIRYAGSILKYSFSEASHIKSVNLVELDSAGLAKIEKLAFKPRYDVRCIEGTLADLISGAANDRNCNDYIKVLLKDRGPVLDAMVRLRDAYPNVLAIERPDASRTQIPGGTQADHRRLTELELFSCFFAQVTGEKLGFEHQEAFVEIVEKLQQKMREA